MTIFRKFFAPTEVRAALSALDEAEFSFCSNDPSRGMSGEAFKIVRNVVQGLLFANKGEFVRMVHRGTSPRQWVWGAVANLTGDLLQSGEYHLYRGVLNPLGPAEQLLRLYDFAGDELVRMGAVSPDYAQKQKAAIRQEIAEVG